MAPPGPVHEAARGLGLRSVELRERLDLPRALLRAFWKDRHSAVLATGVAQSLWAAALRALLRGHATHLHVVHGGTDERLSYGRKWLLAGLDLRFVAVSEFVRGRLEAHGVHRERIEVIHNFLTGPPPPRREPFVTDGVRRVVMLSRLDRIKRVELLFDALERNDALRGLRFDVYGAGEQEQTLRERARRHPNVHLHGFKADAALSLRQADVLLHTCPEEPFGLVLLEAFAAGVPVLVPNSGGAGDIVTPGRNGWHFAANDPVALGQRLQVLMHAPARELNAMAEGGRRALARDFNPQRQAARYAALVERTA
jgi:glycosyltransferase involved in cell wall biosynthesis